MSAARLPACLLACWVWAVSARGHGFNPRPPRPRPAHPFVPGGAGGGIHDSHVVKGMVLKRGVEGTVTRVQDAKVAVFAQGVDTSSTETKASERACVGVCVCCVGACGWAGVWVERGGGGGVCLVGRDAACAHAHA